MSEDWTRVCPRDDIPRLGARVVHGEAGAIAVFRTATDEVFALDDRCPHRGGPLSQGMVFDRRVACPLHGTTIRLDTGEAVAPDTGCTRRHRVRIDRGEVWLRAG